MRRNTYAEWWSWCEQAVVPAISRRSSSRLSSRFAIWVAQAERDAGRRVDALTSEERQELGGGVRTGGCAMSARCYQKPRPIRDADRLGAVTAFEFGSANQFRVRLGARGRRAFTPRVVPASGDFQHPAHSTGAQAGSAANAPLPKFSVYTPIR
jgi:hypothetical protein